MKFKRTQYIQNFSDLISDEIELPDTYAAWLNAERVFCGEANAFAVSATLFESGGFRVRVLARDSHRKTCTIFKLESIL